MLFDVKNTTHFDLFYTDPLCVMIAETGLYDLNESPKRQFLGGKKQRQAVFEFEL